MKNLIELIRIIIILFSVFGIGIYYLTHHNFDQYGYIEHVYSELDSSNYCRFMSTFGIGDPDFIIVRLDKNIEPSDLETNWDTQKNIDTNKYTYFNDRIVLSNYEESSMLSHDAKLNIINKRFLVFSRGGLMFGLYDIALKKAIVNNGSPWHSWLETYRPNKMNGKEELSSYSRWVKINLEDSIKRYIAINSSTF